MSTDYRPAFGEPVGPWFRWFAWHPTNTADRGWRWLVPVWKRRIEKHDYLDGPFDNWFQTAVDIEAAPMTRSDARKKAQERQAQAAPSDARVGELAGEAVMEPWGPFLMGGFEGCTDLDPDACACATDEQPTCVLCDREIEPGEPAWARQWPCYETLPLGHRDQDWDVISWHDACPERADREEQGR